ncbi:MAG TPA: hypothetical protein PKY19_08120, partial [Oscillospiraceae bacterium]|nr:hypothetical protein [Oscillospiraceae bacterium]
MQSFFGRKSKYGREGKKPLSYFKVILPKNRLTWWELCSTFREENSVLGGRIFSAVSGREFPLLHFRTDRISGGEGGSRGIWLCQ